MYHKTVFGGNLIFLTNWVGSALPKAVVPALVSLGLHAIIFNTISEENLEELTIDHPYSVGALVLLVSFLIVFRAQQAYLRFSAAAEWVFHMESKLSHAASQVVSFHHQRSTKRNGTIRTDADDIFLKEFFHLISLVYATNMLELREDSNHGNIVPYHPEEHLGPQGSLRSPMTKPNPTSSFSSSRPPWRPQNIFQSLAYMIGMRGDNVTFYEHSKLPVYGGVDLMELQILDRCANPLVKCNLAMNWLVEFLARGQLAGDLGDVPAPIISRIFQDLSEVMLGFNKARRIKDITYPFILGQLTEFYVMLLIPFVIILNLSVIKSAVLGSLMTGITVMGFVALYEAARDVEDPFLYEPNDLPIVQMLFSFNHSLKMLRDQGICPRDFRLEESVLTKAKHDVALKERAARERAERRAARESPRSSPMTSPTHRGSGVARDAASPTVSQQGSESENRVDLQQCMQSSSPTDGAGMLSPTV